MNRSHDPTRRRAIWQQLAPIAFTCVVTLMSAPGRAQVAIPPVPLQSGTAYPAPNVMFILDNSGSMALISMPFDVQDREYTGTPTGASRSGLRDDPHDRSYLNNTIYYDPHTTYRPWVQADGTRMTGGQDMSKVFTSWAMANDQDIYCGWNCTRAGTRDLRGSDESVFYVPKPGVTASTDPSDFTRYWISSSGKVMTIGGVSTSIPPGYPKTGLALSNTYWADDYIQEEVDVPANALSLIITTSGGNGDADLSVYDPDWDRQCRERDNGNKHTCTFSNPEQGQWRIRVYRDNSFSGVKLEVAIETGSEVEKTPTGRSQEDEAKNIATWYSYYRSRLKTAKGGAAEAFSGLTQDLRVGFTTINDRAPGLTDDSKEVIPVSGHFEDGTNKADWYGSLLGAMPADGSTPLRGALNAVGGYFQRGDAKGPWGPGVVSDQISCRQSFAILTTDGYWNDRSAPSGIGDSDSDGYSVTLADVAHHYYKNDLRPGLTNDVPYSQEETGKPAWQRLITFGVSVGLEGSLDQSQGIPSKWPDPTNHEDEERIDDLWHATVNTHGKFVVAANSAEFARGLLEALASVAERVGSASNVTANSTSLQSDTRLYQASYVSGRWTGELQAYDVSDAGISSVPEWQASKRIPAAADRTILTWDGTAGIGFVTHVKSNSALARTDGLAVVTSTDNAAYLAGDQSKERINGGELRNRATVLGDIVNSSPFYVESTKTIFVGANDGMLHAFAADGRGNGANRVEGGEELFAYVPAGIDLSVLGTLSDPQYSGAHRYFVDGPIVVSNTRQTPGYNYLIGALGRGGRGIFGLDVTDPDGFAAGDVLWDKTFPVSGTAPTGYGNMGQVLGDPLVVTLNDGRKAVLVGNGINSGNGSTTATASLFIINIATGAVIKELNTLATGDNGLSAPRGADMDGDGTVDYAYAADLKGNVWKFDLSDSDPDDWEIAHSGSPMFVATDAAGKRQPITTGLAIARDPATHKVWVFVGTGSYMTDDDNANRDVQSMYGLMDVGVTLDRDDLDTRSIIEVQLKDGRTVRSFQTDPVAVAGSGWVIDLNNPPGAGERVVSNPRIDGTVLAFTSIVPPSGTTCEAGGTGYVNALNAFTGTATTEPYFDANGDGKVDEKDTMTVDGKTVAVGSLGTDAMPSHLVRIGNRYFYGLSDGGSEDEVFNPQGSLARRTSWREIQED